MNAEIACLAAAGEALPEDAAVAFVCDAAAAARLATRPPPAPPATPAVLAGVVLPTEGEARAAQLLEAGAGRVFVGAAALADCGVVERLAQRFGTACVGVYVPAQRMEVSWSFETVSNADFKVVTPSVCEPCWEILRADGSASGTRVHWWLGEMMRRGASAALLRVDIGDDADLNLCAGLAEAVGGDRGERLWLGPLHETAPALADWVAYGRLARIVLPPALFARRSELLPPAAGTEPSASVEAA